MKKMLATALAIVLALGSASLFMNNPDTVITSLATPTMQEYQDKLSALQQQQNELNEQINNASGELDGLKEKKAAIDEKIAVIEEKIQLVSEYTTQMELAIADLDLELRETRDSLDNTQGEIDTGISDYKQRLRAMYIAGNTSYASVLLESDDFYDMLMRMELIKRVSAHDSAIIDNLVSLRDEYQQTEDTLKAKQQDMAATAATYTEQLSQLRADMEELEKLKAENEQASQDINNLLNDLEGQRAEVSQQQAEVSRDIATYTTTTTTTTTTPAPYVPPVENNDGNDGNDGNGGNGGNDGNGGGNSGGGYVPPDLPVASNGSVQTVVDYAKSMVGGRYVFAGSQFAATDCSGLVMLSYAQIGINLPHYAASQAYYGTAVSYDQMQPGDLIFFGYGSYSSIYHVAMYIGNGLMVHAESTETGIVISHIYQRDRIVVIKRLVN